MKTKFFRLMIIVCVISLIICWLTVVAQTPEVPKEPDTTFERAEGYSSREINPMHRRFSDEPLTLRDTAPEFSSTAVTLGEPGLSYRFVQRFGESEVPYFDDSSHINRPWGVGARGSSFWVAENYGRRGIKYNNAGVFLMQINTAGFRHGSEDTIDGLTDIAEDSSGNVWLVDGSACHLVQYDSLGNWLSEIGSQWDCGTGDYQFDWPYSIAFDTVGNIFISDENNHRIQVFNSSGTNIATIGVTGVPGFDNSHFYWPAHIAVDSSNRLYVADYENHRVQIFNVSNLASVTYLATIGVTGVPGNDTGHLTHPEGVDVDESRNRIYVADADNARIMVYNLTTRAYVSNFSTGGYPVDVAVDSSGRIYIPRLFQGYSDVYQYGPTYNLIRTFGATGVPYLTDNYHYFQPSGVAIAPDHSIYIAEGRGFRLIKLNTAGAVQWTIGTPGRNGSTNATFGRLEDVDVDSSGRAYVVDRWNNRIQIYNSDSLYFATLGSGPGSGPYQFNQPYGVAVGPDGRIFVADTGNYRVMVYDSSRNFLFQLGVTGVWGTDNLHFDWPRDVDVDENGKIYIADQYNHRVQIFNSDGSHAMTIGESGVHAYDFGHLNWPTSVTVDNSGRIFVADDWGYRILVYDQTGAFLTVLGGYGGGNSGELRDAGGLATDSFGNLYVAETENHRIQKFSPGEANWVQVNLNGFGDVFNYDIRALAGLNNELFAGTVNYGGAQILKKGPGNQWTLVNSPGFGNTNNNGINDLFTFKTQLYAGVRNTAEGAMIYRSSDGSTWNPVVTGGFITANTFSIYEFAEFNNQIYAGTGGWSPGGEIWRSPSGDAGSWTQVVANGFDHTYNYIMVASALHNGYLYYGTQNADPSFQNTLGGIVIRSNSGDSGSWAKVSNNGFGDINNNVILGLVSFNGYLYASTGRWNNSGVQVWRCQVCSTQGDWVKVVDNGFGNPNNDFGILKVFDGLLYLVIGNGDTGVEVWRSNSGNVGEWFNIHNGGFGDSTNAYSVFNNGVAEFAGNLFIGLQNYVVGAELWEFLHEWIFLPIAVR